MSDWLKDLKYVWKCTECPKTYIGVEAPINCSCGATIYLLRCAEKLGYVQTDSLDNVVSPIDGKPYDSKSSYYKSIQEAGCNIIEDNPLERKGTETTDYDVQQELKDAIDEVEAKTGVSI